MSQLILLFKASSVMELLCILIMTSEQLCISTLVFSLSFSPFEYCTFVCESKIGEAKLYELIESTRGTIYRQGNPRDGL